MKIESSWLLGNTRIRIWWHPKYWCVHSFKDGGRRATAFGPLEVYTGE